VVAISVRPSKTAPPDGLPRDAPPQCVFQPRVLTFQAHPLTLDEGSFGLLSFKLATQSRILTPQVVDRIGGLLLGAPAHAPVMPEFRSSPARGFDP
jgi:hypothetical protein